MSIKSIGLFIVLVGVVAAAAYFLAKRKNKVVARRNVMKEEESPSFKALNDTIREIESN
jgi:hypothetical protein